MPTPHRIVTLMHDPQYRLAVAWQNTAYNQPPHPSFYLDEGTPLPPRPDITTVVARQ
jgi:rhamnogalacturonan endolyase